MEDKRYRLPPVYAYLTFWLSVAAGVATFFRVNGPWYVTFPAALAVFMGTNLLTSIIGALYWRMPGSETLHTRKGLVSVFLWGLFGAACALTARSGSRHERRKYRQIAHHAPLRLSRLDPPATAAPIARLLPKPAMLGHDAGAFAGRALRVRGGVQPMNAGGPGGLQLQLRDVGIDYREALLAEHHAIGQAQPVVSRPAARNSLIRLP